MSNRSNDILLSDIIEATDKIKKYTANLDYEDFSKDDKTIDAVIRNFEIIGEASARLDIDFKEKNKKIDWKRLKGFRNRIIHEYFGVDLAIVWNIIQNDLNTLIENIEEIKRK